VSSRIQKLADRSKLGSAQLPMRGLARPASLLWVGDEPMFEAPLAVNPPITRKWAGRRTALMKSLSLFSRWRHGTGVTCAGQPDGVAVVAAGQISSGVESGPKAGKGLPSEPGNLAGASFGMAKTTGERTSRGRSPRSSPRAGKPSTWRRGTVNTAGRQEGDILCPSR